MLCHRRRGFRNSLTISLLAISVLAKHRATYSNKQKHKKTIDPQRSLFTDAILMDGETIYIDMVANLLQLVSDQEMGLSIHQLNGIHKLKSDFTIVL